MIVLVAVVVCSLSDFAVEGKLMVVFDDVLHWANI